MDINLLKQNLQTRLVGQTILYQEKVASTNTWASDKLSKEDIATGTVFIANEQTEGKGRLKRHWFSQKSKDLTFSLIDNAPPNPAESNHLTLVIAVAVQEALKQIDPQLNPQLKWPNDIQINNKKLAGILCETKNAKVIIGIGLNVLTTAGDFPEELKDKMTSLSESTTVNLNREKILATILNSYEKWRSVYDQQGLAGIIPQWNQYSAHQDKQIIVDQSGESYQGEYRGLDNQGFLIVQVAGKEKTIHSGDVTIVT